MISGLEKFELLKESMASRFGVDPRVFLKLETDKLKQLAVSKLVKSPIKEKIREQMDKDEGEKSS